MTFAHSAGENLSSASGSRNQSADAPDVIAYSVKVTEEPSVPLYAQANKYLDKSLDKLDQELNNMELIFQRIKRIPQHKLEKAFSLLKSSGKITSSQAFQLILYCGAYVPEMERGQRNKLLEGVCKTLTSKSCTLDVSHYNGLLKVYLENEYRFDPQEFLNIMNQQGIQPNKVTYQHLISKYCQHGDIEQARNVMKIMYSKIMSVDEFIYNELIIGYAKANNMEDARNVLDVMKNAGLSPKLSTYVSLACGYAITGYVERILQTMKDIRANGFLLQDADTLKIIYLLTVNGHGHHVDKVTPMIQRNSGYNYDCINIILELVNAGYHAIGFTLLNTMARTKSKDGSFAPAGNFFIKHLVKKNLPTDVIMSYCDKLQSTGLNQDPYITATTEALHLKKTAQATAFLKKLQPHNLKQLKEIITKLEETSLVLDGQACARFINFFCQHSDLETALKYKKMIDTKFPDFQLQDYVVINLATLLMVEKTYEDAESVILKHHSKFGITDNTESIKRNIFNLLDSCTTSRQIENAQNMFELLHKLGYCKPENVLLGNLIKAYFIRNDVSGAVKEFIRIAGIYRVTPWLSELFKHLIQLEDSDKLQEVTDAAKKIHGEGNIVLSLVCSLIENDRYNEAQKIVETSNIQVTTNRLDSVCERYVEKNMTKELETFFQITKNVSGINRDHLCYQLLKAYVKEQDLQKVLDFWKMTQSEGVQLSDLTLQFLGRILQEMNQPVPFIIPTNVEGNSKDRTILQEMLKEKNVEEVLKAKQRLSLEDGSLTVEDCSTIISMLLENNRLQDALILSDELFAAGFYPNVRVARLLAIKLAEIGEKKCIFQLEDRLPTEIAKIIPFRDYLAITDIRHGEWEKFLSSLESDHFKHKYNFPGGGLLALLKEKPEVLERVKNLANLYYEEGVVIPRNMLWIYLMINRCFEEANQIFQSTPEMHSHLYFQDVTRQIRISNDVEMSQHLVDCVKCSNLNDRAKGIIYSSHLNVLLAVNKVDEALTNLNEALKIVEMKVINSGALLRLRDSLVSAGKTVPFNISLSTKQVKNINSSVSANDVR